MSVDKFYVLFVDYNGHYSGKVLCAINHKIAAKLLHTKEELLGLLNDESYGFNAYVGAAEAVNSCASGPYVKTPLPCIVHGIEIERYVKNSSLPVRELSDHLRKSALVRLTASVFTSGGEQKHCFYPTYLSTSGTEFVTNKPVTDDLSRIHWEAMPVCVTTEVIVKATLADKDWMFITVAKWLNLDLNYDDDAEAQCQSLKKQLEDCIVTSDTKEPIEQPTQEELSNEGWKMVVGGKGLGSEFTGVTLLADVVSLSNVASEVIVKVPSWFLDSSAHDGALIIENGIITLRMAILNTGDKLYMVKCYK